jgi:hypothetical protein
LYANATKSSDGTALVLLPKPLPPKQTFFKILNDFVTRVLN